MADRTVEVLLKANVAQYKAAMASAAGSTKALSAAGDKAIAKQALFEKRMTAGAARIQRASKIAAVAVGAALVVSAKKASDLEESLNKSNVVFGQSAKEIEAWSETMANSFGISAESALKVGSQFGDMLTQMGLSTAEAAKLSRGVVELTADMGSYHNLPTEEVSQKIASAMRGEYESIRSIIPAINMKRVQEEAMLATGKKNVANLTAQDKALATLKIITDDSANAAGDFGRTQDGAANSVKTMEANMADASAELGKSLLPMMTSGAQALSKLANGFSDLSPTMQKATVAAVAATIAFGLLAPTLSRLAIVRSQRTLAATLDTIATTANTAATTGNTTATTANTAATGTNAAAQTRKAGALGASGAAAGASGVAAAGGAAGWLKYAKVMGGAAAAIVGGGYALNEFMFSQRESVEVSNDASTAITESNGALNERTRSIADAIILENELGGTLRGSKTTLDTQRLAVLGNAEAIAEVEHGYREATGAAKGSNTAFNSSGAALSDLSGKLANFADATSDAWGPLDELKRLANEGLEPALEELTRQLALGGDGALDLAKDLIVMGKAAGKSTDEIKVMLEQAGVPPKKIVLLVDIAEAEAAVVRAQAKIDSLKQYKHPMITAAVDDAERELDKAQKRINDLKQNRGDIPNVDAKIDKAEAKVRKIENDLNGIQDEVVNITIYERKIKSGQIGGSGSPAGRASGGAVFGPGTSTSDSIPAMLSDGEYVIKASSARSIGYDRLDDLNSGVQRFAKGGKAKRRKKKQAARQSRFDAANQAYNERFAYWGEKAQNIGEYRADTSRSMGKGQLSSFDFGGQERASRDYTLALNSQTNAEANLFEARKRLNESNRANRPAALRDLAAAQRDLASSSEDVASAEQAKADAAPTAENILKNYQDRVAKTQTWANDMNTLRAWGLPATLASEILGSGLEAGSAMAAALVAGGAGNIGAFQASAGALRGATDSLGFSAGMSDALEGDLTYHDVEKAAAALVGSRPVLKTGFKKKKKKKKKKRRALGGQVSAGEEYLVGEQGMELFSPGVSGSIVSNSALMSGRAFSGSNAGVSSAPISISLDGNSLWQGLVDHDRLSGFTIRAL